jgi:hypothetical protein
MACLVPSPPAIKKVPFHIMDGALEPIIVFADEEAVQLIPSDE